MKKCNTHDAIRDTMKRFSFPKSKKLVSNEQFKEVLTHNLCASDDLLTLYMAENDCGYPRLGVSVGKPCGGAVVRNRLKRLLREAFRQSQGRIPAGFDYVLMISPQWSKNRPGPKQVNCQLVKDSLLNLIAKSLSE